MVVGQSDNAWVANGKDHSAGNHEKKNSKTKDYSLWCFPTKSVADGEPWIKGRKERGRERRRGATSSSDNISDVDFRETRSACPQLQQKNPRKRKREGTGVHCRWLWRREERFYRVERRSNPSRIRLFLR